MRILITTGIFKPEPGGPATYAAELGSRLKAAGHTVAVITYSNGRDYEGDKAFAFPIIRVPRRGNKLINYFSYFLAVRRRIVNCDVIYSLDWFSAGVPVMIAAHRANKKYFVRVGGGYIWEKYLAQGNIPVTLKEFYTRNLHKKYPIMYFLIKKVLKNAHKVIFNSDDQRDLYIKHYDLDYNHSVTICNAVPEHKFGSLVRSYKIDVHNRDKEFVFAGRYIKMKNIESLIKAFAKLSDPTFKLLLIGEGPTEPLLRKLVEELQLEGKVAFEKTLSQRDLYRRIANCYCVVIPSWTDISPNQVYECLSLGIPFLLTKENYLSINKHDFLKIDPASVEDIAEKMNLLLDPAQYEAFTDKLARIEFRRNWNDVTIEHMRLFKQNI